MVFDMSDGASRSKDSSSTSTAGVELGAAARINCFFNGGEAGLGRPAVRLQAKYPGQAVYGMVDASPPLR
jgi:hypothetical protein